jgi:hypothetical protein
MASLLKKWWFENDFVHVNAINHEKIGLQIIASKDNEMDEVLT